MQAMLLKKPNLIENNPLQFVELEKPKIKSDEILIKVKVCGVCHTDLHTVEGELQLPKKPLVPGHQVVGVVEESGSEVTRFKIGDRVGMAWLHSACEKCKFCLAEKENLCENAKFTGYHVDGGYAQYAVISQNFAYHIPDGFSDVQAAPLLCGGIIGYRALRLSGIKPGGVLGLYGFGNSAHVAIQIAVHWGCEVFVFTRSEEHQRLALDLGAVWTGTSKDKAPQKLDSAIIFAPAGKLVPDALEALDKGGTLALAGIYMTPVPQLDYSKHLYHERTLRSVANATRRDGEELLKLAAEIPIRTTTTAFPLKDANKVLQLLKQSKIDGAAVLEIPS
jgi:propanol-preferring alcohol dehydrogenase